jgi:hypothetical protein
MGQQPQAAPPRVNLGAPGIVGGSLAPVSDACRTPIPSGVRRSSRATLAGVLAAVVVVGTALTGCGTSGGPSVGDEAEPTSTPLAIETALPTPGSAEPAPAPETGFGWLRVVRGEPASGADDVALRALGPDRPYLIADEAGEVGHEWIDIVELSMQPESTLTEGGVGMALRYRLALAGPAAHTAYGVVIDVDRDGVGDHMVGMDNDSPTNLRHAEWIADLATGGVSMNRSADTFGHGAFGTFVDSWFPGEGRPGNIMIVAREPETGEGSIRFYFWASTLADDARVTDYAPDTGWITFTPQPPPEGP